MATEKLKVYQVRALFNAIKAMDGRYTESRDGDGKLFGLVQKPYKFDDAKPIYAMARTAEKLRPVLVAIDKAQNSLTEGVGDDRAAIDKANRAVNEFLDTEVEVELFKFPVAALCIHKNDIGPAILSDLLPMLTGEI